MTRNPFRFIKDPHEKQRPFPSDPAERTGLANALGRMGLVGHLELDVHRKGTLGKWHDDHIDCGDGTVTNAGVNLLVNDSLDWALGSSMADLLYHASGTGATASAASDYFLQTAIGSGSLTGSTNGYFTGTGIVVAPNIFRTAATMVYSAAGPTAVTEWIIANANWATVASTFTGTTVNSGTVSGAPFVATNGNQGGTIEIGGPINTPTSTVMGLVTANSTTVCTLGVTTAGGWSTLANANPASTPGNVAFVLNPTAFDHLVFAAVNVYAGDSVSPTFSLSLSSGG
jgi:hypothetical protein